MKTETMADVKVINKLRKRCVNTLKHTYRQQMDEGVGDAHREMYFGHQILSGVLLVVKIMESCGN